MGIDSASAIFLCGARSSGADFARTAMIGRQGFFPDAAVLRRVFSMLGIHQDAERFLRENPYAEPYFTALGAREVASVDFSDYENATIIHDMNSPIPDGLRARYSVVYDGGTLEHIFNIYQALKNCMEMVELGGHFLQQNCANNYMGHGFWQFSPELIFRAFSPANGFETEAVLLHELGGAWYVVADPDEVRARVQLCNFSHTYILSIARRVALKEVFATPPQQSDYVAMWGGDEADPRSRPARNSPGLREASRRYVPGPLRRALRSTAMGLPYLDRINPCGFEQSCYRRIHEADVLRGKLSWDGHPATG